MDIDQSKILNLVVVSSSLEQKHVPGLVIYAGKKYVNQYVRIDVVGESICVASDQQFYDSKASEWISADALRGRGSLNGKSVSVYLVNEPLEIYVIGVVQYHNFFVTSSDICVHNFVPAVIVGLSVLFGSGGLELAGVGFGLAGLGTYLGYRWHKSNRQPHAVMISSIEQATGNHDLNEAQAPGMPTEEDGYYPPKKWDGKKVKNPKGGGFGWPDKKGHVWVSTGPKAHRGPHWDVQDPKTGRHRNVLPGGRVC